MKTYFKGFVVGMIFMAMMNSFVFAGGLLETIDVLWNSVNIEILGEKIEMNNLLYNGTTYVPLREISKAFGKKVEWDKDSNTANITPLDMGTKADVEEGYSDIIDQAKLELDGISEKLTDMQNHNEIEKILQDFKEMSKLDIEYIYFGAQDSGGMSIIPKTVLPEDYDPRQRPWYTNADNDYYIADVYTDIRNGAQILSMSKPVYQKDKLVGVVGIDIKLGIE
jgi:hypothetical protein